MKKVIFKTILIISIISSFSFGSTGYGKIKNIDLQGNGNLIVIGAEQDDFVFANAPEHSKNKFYIKPSHPHYKAILSVLLTAKSTGASLKVTVDLSEGWIPFVCATNDCEIQINSTR